MVRSRRLGAAALGLIIAGAACQSILGVAGDEFKLNGQSDASDSGDGDAAGDSPILEDRAGETDAAMD